MVLDRLGFSDSYDISVHASLLNDDLRPLPAPAFPYLPILLSGCIIIEKIYNKDPPNLTIVRGLSRNFQFNRYLS
jgi:hypothetical protein